MSHSRSFPVVIFLPQLPVDRSFPVEKSRARFWNAKLVLMNMSDCIKYMKLKANKPNFKDTREVLKKLKEDKAKKDAT